MGSISRCFYSLVKVCVMLKKEIRWRICGDEIRSSSPRPHYGVASSVVGGRVKMCLRRISQDSVDVSLQWIFLDQVFVRLHLSIYELGPSDLRFSSSATVVVLLRWFCGFLAGQLPNYLPQ